MRSSFRARFASTRDPSCPEARVTAGLGIMYAPMKTLALENWKFLASTSEIYPNCDENFEYLEPTTVAKRVALVQPHAGEAKVFRRRHPVTILMKQGFRAQCFG